MGLVPPPLVVNRSARVSRMTRHPESGRPQGDLSFLIRQLFSLSREIESEASTLNHQLHDLKTAFSERSASQRRNDIWPLNSDQREAAPLHWLGSNHFEAALQQARDLERRVRCPVGVRAPAREVSVCFSRDRVRQSGLPISHRCPSGSTTEPSRHP
jgi:hypothetical protein